MAGCRPWVLAGAERKRKMIEFHYPYYPFQWYKNRNPVSGNAGQFNFKVVREGEELAAYCWMGFWCMEKTKDVLHERFPFEEGSVGKAEQWLSEQFSQHSREEIESKEGFFTTQPYTPPKPEPPQQE